MGVHQGLMWWRQARICDTLREGDLEVMDTLVHRLTLLVPVWLPTGCWRCVASIKVDAVWKCKRFYVHLTLTTAGLDLESLALPKWCSLIGKGKEYVESGFYVSESTLRGYLPSILTPGNLGNYSFFCQGSPFWKAGGIYKPHTLAHVGGEVQFLRDGIGGIKEWNRKKKWCCAWNLSCCLMEGIKIKWFNLKPI